MQGPAEHPDLRRHRHRQDDAAERPLERDSRQRAHRHHRGRGRAPAAAGPRRPPGDPPAQHRGEGRGDPARPGAQRAAHAPRPDHRGRGARRGGPGHAPGHEHRARRLDVHRPRQLAPRCPVAARDHGADGRDVPPRPRDAGIHLVRPGRADPPRAPERRHAEGHAGDRGRRDGGRHGHPAGHLSSSIRRASGRTARSWGSTGRPASGPGLPNGCKAAGIPLDPAVFEPTRKQ